MILSCTSPKESNDDSNSGSEGDNSEGGESSSLIKGAVIPRR